MSNPPRPSGSTEERSRRQASPPVIRNLAAREVQQIVVSKRIVVAGPTQIPAVHHASSTTADQGTIARDLVELFKALLSKKGALPTMLLKLSMLLPQRSTQTLKRVAPATSTSL